MVFDLPWDSTYSGVELISDRDALRINHGSSLVTITIGLCILYL